jgi:hypothetical protein
MSLYLLYHPKAIEAYVSEKKQRLVVMYACVSSGCRCRGGFPDQYFLCSCLRNPANSKDMAEVRPVLRQVKSLQHFDLWWTLRYGQKGSLTDVTETIAQTSVIKLY